MTGAEQVLIEDWCQQYPSHSIGALEFGPDGALYASGGDGASFNFVDYGQDGSPLNPCGDPPGRGRRHADAPDRRGRRAAQPGPAHQRRPGHASTARSSGSTRPPARGCRTTRWPRPPTPNARRIIAYGLRNPFRFTFRPGTNEIWVGDVGWNDWEEINRILNPTDGVVENFGWPCYEGTGRQSGYDGANLNICENLYGQPGAVTAPYYAYHHSNRVVAERDLPDRQLLDRRPGVRFADSASTYPAEYDGALFFADYSRDCIWVDAQGRRRPPGSGQIRTFVGRRRQPGQPGDRARRRPVLRRLRRRHDPAHPVHRRQPAADRRRHGHPDHRPAPAHRQLRRHRLQRPGPATRSPTPGTSTATARSTTPPRPQPTFTYTASGTYTASLRVTDSQGASDTATVTITVGNTPPTATIDHARPPAPPGRSATSSPSPARRPTPRTARCRRPALTWQLILQHCPSNCHQHPVQTSPGVASRLVHRARPRVPVVPGAAADRDRLGRADRHQDRSGSTRGPWC